jgi:hypothetical protein
MFRLLIRRAVAFTQVRDEEGVEVPDARRDPALRFHSTYPASFAATAMARFFKGGPRVDDRSFHAVSEIAIHAI